MLIQSIRRLIHRVSMKLELFWRRIFWRGHLPDGTHYLSGQDALPPPLSREEEGVLVSELKKGDPLVKQMLVERNLRLVVYIARKFDNTGIQLEDLIGIGSIGLIKAVNTFDPEKKIKLATYASRCIENEILMFLRRNHRTRTEVSFDEPLNVDWDGNELLLADVVGTEDDVIEKDIEAYVERELLSEALEMLSDRERTIMELRFGLNGGEEMTQKEVADLLGISQSYISRLEKRIIKRLKKEMNPSA